MAQNKHKARNQCILDDVLHVEAILYQSRLKWLGCVTMVIKVVSESCLAATEYTTLYGIYLLIGFSDYKTGSGQFCLRIGY